MTRLHRKLSLALTALFAAALLFAAVPQWTSVAYAKGPVGSSDSSSSGSQDSGNQQKPTPPPAPSQNEPKPSPPPQERQESRSSSGSSVFGNRQERRDEPSNDTSRPSSSERRDEGTPSVFGQIQKRDENRDPEYEYRRHYHDSFYYPYDRQFWSRYPYYERGTVIIIDDSWSDPHRKWRREYTYLNPLPGSIEEALVDIEATWWEREPEFLMWHVDPAGSVDIYYKGSYSHSVTPRQIYKLTDEALRQIRTTEFRFTSVEKDGIEVRAVAKHEFDGPDGKHRTAKLVYYLTRDRDRWIVTQIDFNKTDYGSPKCFIATAAYGTPMDDEVLALRQFRDRYLLPNPVGKKLVDLYYAVSPPIADSIRDSEEAKAVVRMILSPIVQACKVLVGN